MAKKKNTMREDGRISVQIYIGIVDGKRKYKTVYGHTQKEANEKANEVKIALGKGIDVLSTENTFKDWRDRFILIKSVEVRSGMMTTYNACVRHLDPLNYMDIGKVKTFDIQAIISKLALLNPNTKKPSSKRTLSCIKMTAEQIFKLAIENRVIDYNPATYVKIPVDSIVEKRRALTDDEQEWIISTHHRAQPAAMIMMYAGLRRGELMALKWKDIDIDNRTITVNKTIEMISGKPTLKAMTKTASGMRTVDIPNTLAEYLKGLIRSNILVCAQHDGTYMSTSAWRSMWNSYLADLNIKYGDFKNCIKGKNDKKPKSKFEPNSKHNPQGVPLVIPKITAHWLRHTFATMLYFAGVDILTAKEQLGHSDIKTTLEIYTHLDSQFKRRSMDKLDSYISEKKNNASQMQVK